MDVSPASGLVEGQAQLPAAFLDDEGQGAAQQVRGAGRIGRRRFRSHTQILIAEKPSQCQKPSKGALWKTAGTGPAPSVTSSITRRSSTTAWWCMTRSTTPCASW